MNRRKRGGRNRRRGRKVNNNERKLVFKDEEQVYAECEKMQGDNRLKAFCFDGKRRLCKIKGSMVKKVWISTKDILIVSKRDFDDDKGDVIHKYSQDEVRQLRKMKILPSEKEIHRMKNPSKHDEDDAEIVFDLI